MLRMTVAGTIAVITVLMAGLALPNRSEEMYAYQLGMATLPPASNVPGTVPPQGLVSGHGHICMCRVTGWPGSQSDVPPVMDGDPGTVWRTGQDSVEHPLRGVVVSFDQAVAIDYVRLLPVSAEPLQFPNSLYLEGSSDGHRWTIIGRLGAYVPDAGAEWRTWQISPARAFRKYRLLVPGGNLNPRNVGYSELELYAVHERLAAPTIRPEPATINSMQPVTERIIVGDGLLPPHNVVHSSRNLRHQQGYAAFDGNPETYWHPDPALAEEKQTAWLLVDLEASPDLPPNIIEIVSRRDRPAQSFSSALISSSRDGREWRTLAHLQATQEPIGGLPVRWRLPPGETARYYLFEFLSGFSNGQFLSVAEVRLIHSESLAGSIADRRHPKDRPDL